MPVSLFSDVASSFLSLVRLTSVELVPLVTAEFEDAIDRNRIRSGSGRIQ